MHQAARKASIILLKSYGKIKPSQIRYKSVNDLVTHVDHASQNAIMGILNHAFPDYGVHAEEAGLLRVAKRMWIIDPLDGTVNYIHRFPFFCISIAMIEDGVIQCGLIYDPIHKESFWASRGEGAYLNRRRILVSKTRSLSKAFLVTGFPFRAKSYFEPYHQSFRKIFYSSMGIRRAGSAALDLAYTACGRTDGFWEFGLKIWDIAAGVLLIEEAGGSVSDFRGLDRYLSTGDIVAGNRLVQKSLVRILKKIPFSNKK